MIVGKWGKTQKVKTIINRRIQAFIVDNYYLSFCMHFIFIFSLMYSKNLNLPKELILFNSETLFW